MLRQVVTNGTGVEADIAGWEIAGKTGTAHKHNPLGGYFKDRYHSLFVGIVPASNPRFVTVVAIDEPNKEMGHYGGAVAAPVFSKVMEGTLRILNIPPDDLDSFNKSLLADSIRIEKLQGYE